MWFSRWCIYDLSYALSQEGWFQIYHYAVDLVYNFPQYVNIFTYYNAYMVEKTKFFSKEEEEKFILDSSRLSMQRLYRLWKKRAFNEYFTLIPFYCNFLLLMIILFDLLAIK